MGLLLVVFHLFLALVLGLRVKVGNGRKIIFAGSEECWWSLLYGGQNLNGCSIYVVKVIMFIGEDGEIINTSYYYV